MDGLELSDCTEDNLLKVNLKIIKIADDFPDYPLWSTTNTTAYLKVGTVGCHSSCLTCDGPTAFNCLTCNISTEYPYLYKSRCLSRCESDMPYSKLIFQENSYAIAYYQCTDDCGPGRYLNKELKICFDCNYQCGNCTGGSPRECINCKGTYVNADSNLNDFNEIGRAHV